MFCDPTDLTCSEIQRTERFSVIQLAELFSLLRNSQSIFCDSTLRTISVIQLSEHFLWSNAENSLSDPTLGLASSLSDHVTDHADSSRIFPDGCNPRGVLPPDSLCISASTSGGLSGSLHVFARSAERGGRVSARGSRGVGSVLRRARQLRAAGEPNLVRTSSSCLLRVQVCLEKWVRLVDDAAAVETEDEVETGRGQKEVCEDKDGGRWKIEGRCWVRVRVDGEALPSSQLQRQHHYCDLAKSPNQICEQLPRAFGTQHACVCLLSQRRSNEQHQHVSV